MNQRSLVDNAGDEKQVANAEKVENKRTVEFEDDLKWVLSTGSGRRVVARFLQMCFWEYGDAAHAMGHHMQDAIELADPAGWLLLEKERLELQGKLKREVKEDKELEESGD